MKTLYQVVIKETLEFDSLIASSRNELTEKLSERYGLNEEQIEELVATKHLSIHENGFVKTVFVLDSTVIN